MMRRQHLGDGTLHVSVDQVGLPPADEEATDDRQHGNDDALAQLFQVLQQAHFWEFLRGGGAGSHQALCSW